MGRHAASEGSAVHPIVAGALARRTAESADGHGEQAPVEGTGPVGWPAPPAPGGGGLGWPSGDPAPAGLEDGRAERAPSDAASPAAQRGWRRLFRLRPAA